MKKIVVFAFTAILTNLTIAQEYNWLMSFGGTNDDQGYDCKACPDGNYIFCGTFRDTMEFNGIQLKSKGEYRDAFIIKVSSAGELIWSYTFGENPEKTTDARGVYVDENNNVFVCGSFYSFLKINGDSIPGYEDDGQDAYLLKLTTEGEFSWIKVFKGPGNDYLDKISVSGSTVFLTGKYSNSLTINDITIESEYPGISTSASCAFAAGFNLEGDLSWVTKVNAKSSFMRNLTAPDSKYVYCVTEMSVDESSPFITIAGNASYKYLSLGNPQGSDVYVLKLDGISGEVVWSNRISSSGSDMSYAISFDTDTNIYCAGLCNGNTKFTSQGTSAIDVKAPGSKFDMFLSKYNKDGAIDWAKIYGGPSSEGIYDIIVTTWGDIYALGYFLDEYTVLGSDTLHCQNDGNEALFIMFDEQGGYEWAKQTNTLYYSDGAAKSTGYLWQMDLSEGDTIIMTGYYRGTGMFFNDEEAAVTDNSKNVWLASIGLDAPSSIYGIDDVTDNLMVYPVPSNQIVHVKNNSGSEIISLSLTDIEGKVLKTVDAFTGSFDVRDCSPGIYFLYIRFDNGLNETRKLIITQ